MIKIEEKKLPQHNLSSQKFSNPKRVFLPLSQHVGEPSQPKVKVGDVIEEASLIAEVGGMISASLHAPKRGKITGIEEFAHPVLKRAKSIVLTCEDDQKVYSEKEDIDKLTKEELLTIIKNSGIVGMGGACFPTHIKLNPPKKIDIVLINGCECEPYLACDYRLMVENTDGILRGVEIISKLIEPKEIFFCIEENKPDAIKKFNLSLSIKRYNLPPSRVVVINSNYPQGGERQLIYKVTKRKVPSGGLPFDCGCLAHNVATCFAIYEAVYLAKPLIERLVTFAGDCLVSPKNVWVRIGTLISELFENKILEFKKEPKKVINGGPMMGQALDNLDYPILKGTSGILFFSKEIVDIKEEQNCIRCARCVDSCPMNLVPLEYVKRVKREEFTRLEEIFIKDCIECGCCGFVCPAKIPIVHYIKVGKQRCA
jgi:electron transport complex protein RnfC